MTECSLCFESFTSTNDHIPQQLSCCGKSYCITCINSIQASTNQSCPSCRHELNNISITPNRSLIEIIEQGNLNSHTNTSNNNFMHENFIFKRVLNIFPKTDHKYLKFITQLIESIDKLTNSRIINCSLLLFCLLFHFKYNIVMISLNTIFYSSLGTILYRNQRIHNIIDTKLYKILFISENYSIFFHNLKEYLYEFGFKLTNVSYALFFGYFSIYFTYNLYLNSIIIISYLILFSKLKYNNIISNFIILLYFIRKYSTNFWTLHEFYEIINIILIIPIYLLIFKEYSSNIPISNEFLNVFINKLKLQFPINTLLNYKITFYYNFIILSYFIINICFNYFINNNNSILMNKYSLIFIFYWLFDYIINIINRLHLINKIPKFLININNNALLLLYKYHLFIIINMFLLFPILKNISYSSNSMILLG